MNLRTAALIVTTAAGAAYAVHRWHQADKQRAIQRTRAELERTRQQIIAEYIKQEDDDFGVWAEENLDNTPAMTPEELELAIAGIHDRYDGYSPYGRLS